MGEENMLSASYLSLSLSHLVPITINSVLNADQE